MGVFSEVSAVYDALPHHCKPRVGEEFTVLAAFLLRDSNSGLHVLSMASGTKCCNAIAYKDQEDTSSTEREDGLKGTIIEDSHAEVLARRGLVQYLMDSIETLTCEDHIDEDNKSVINPLCIDATTAKISWKQGYELVLYISDNPCGDACIYARKHKHVGNIEAGMRFTGAKPTSITAVISVTENANASSRKRKHAQVSEQEQELGIPRLKSGRSDINQKHRTSSMCCSDKLCRWTHLGLQGSLLSCICGTIPLHEVVVDQDLLAVSSEEQLQALRRAIVTRSQPTTDANNTTIRQSVVPRLSIRNEGTSSTHRYMQGKCMSEYAHLQAEVEKDEVPVKEAGEEKKGGEKQTSKQMKKKTKRRGMRPSGCSFNWIRDVRSSSSDHNNKSKTGSGKNSSEYTLTNHSKTYRTSTGTYEVTQAQSGYLLGATKAQYGLPGGSRLCRRKQFMKFNRIITETKGKCLRGGLEHEYRSTMEPCREKQKTKHGQDQEGEGGGEGERDGLPYRWWKELNEGYTSQRDAFLDSDTFRDKWQCCHEERNQFYAE